MLGMMAPGITLVPRTFKAISHRTVSVPLLNLFCDYDFHFS